MNSKEIIQIFESYQNDEKAISMKAYMKDQFEFLGIQSPLRKQITKELLVEARREAIYDSTFFRDLWLCPYREMQYVAQEYMFYTRKWWTDSIMNDLEFALLEKSWWDTVDFLSSTILGYLYRDSKERYYDTVRSWVTDEDMWLRRTSIIFQLKYKEQVDTEFLSFALEKNLGSDQFFINKAIGWALRQYSKYNAPWVSDFVETHPLSTLSKREATKYLT